MGAVEAVLGSLTCRFVTLDFIQSLQFKPPKSGGLKGAECLELRFIPLFRTAGPNERLY